VSQTIDLQCDALVVGAGPAGTGIALRLARRGANVVMMERARLPRTKVCGEYLSPATLDSLSDLGLLDTIRAQAHGLATLRMAGFGIGPVAMRLPGFGGLAIERARFDMLLADAAAKAGARLIAGTFVSASETGDGVDVSFRDEAGGTRHIRAAVLVGADGSWSTVAQHCGMADRQRRGGRWAVGGHLRTPSDGDAVEMFVGPAGYYARNPLGGGLTNAMLVMPRPLLDDEAETATRHLSDGRYGFQADALVRRVVVGPLRYRARVAARGRVILAGDAAELFDPFLGQGIAFALGLSTAAAETASRLIAGERTSEAVRVYRTSRGAAARSVRVMARAVDALLRIRWLRGRAARKLARHPELADQLLAAVAGSAPNSRRLALAWDLIA
jgi:flavin-dependent dehydrogenase